MKKDGCWGNIGATTNKNVLGGGGCSWLFLKQNLEISNLSLLAKKEIKPKGCWEGCEIVPHHLIEISNETHALWSGLKNWFQQKVCCYFFGLYLWPGTNGTEQNRPANSRIRKIEPMPVPCQTTVLDIRVCLPHWESTPGMKSRRFPCFS